MRLDVGLSQRRLAELAAIDHGFLSLIERGLREPSLAVLVAIANALGGSVSVRLFPGTGPRVRDAIQARITEALVHILHPRWTRMVEVPVHRPASGVIDVVAHERVARIILATEIQSELHRVEQQLRWSNEKAESLPSADFWRFIEDDPKIDRLLILRSTRNNRAIAARFVETLAVAFPADPTAAYRALTTPDAPWPGSALLWATVEGDVARILERAPRAMQRGVSTGLRSRLTGIAAECPRRLIGGASLEVGHEVQAVVARMMGVAVEPQPEILEACQLGAGDRLEGRFAARPGPEREQVVQAERCLDQDRHPAGVAGTLREPGDGRRGGGLALAAGDAWRSRPGDLEADPQAPAARAHRLAQDPDPAIDDGRQQHR